MQPAYPSRRGVLRGAAFSAMTLASLALTSPAGAAPTKPTTDQAPGPSRPISLNGWDIEESLGDELAVAERPVPGTGLYVSVRLGIPEALLVNLVRRVNYEISPVLLEELNGWQELGTTALESARSNLASGTAVQIRPNAKVDAYFPLDVNSLRAILASYEGVITWGGDEAEKDESFFYINRGPDDDVLERVGRSIRIADETPGQGAGTV